MSTIYQQGGYSLSLGAQTVTIPFNEAFAAKPAAVIPVVSNPGPTTLSGEPKYLITAMLASWDANGFTLELSAPTNRTDYRVEWIAGDFSAVYSVVAHVKKLSTLQQRTAPLKPTDLITVVDSTGTPKTEVMTAEAFLQNILTLTSAPTNPAAPGANNQVAVDDTYIHTFFNGAWKSARRDSTTGSSSSSPWRVVSGTAVALANDRILANTTSSAFSITLPATPTIGQEVVCLDYAGTWGTNNLTLVRNGSLIEGTTENYICDVSAPVRLVFVGSSVGWKTFTF